MKTKWKEGNSYQIFTEKLILEFILVWVSRSSFRGGRKCFLTLYNDLYNIAEKLMGFKGNLLYSEV